ncbi:MAG: putative toxin-antitoxin system toxin component, PIN family [Caldilineaceae bacterium]|nr:putative toxin-antitoxin system toxin component, PIN family [Caldilineaceae bacterium]MBP8109475.1 putative toxin-antitoxin system toxin component, PIN family [Caldilineaceae bacterium]MBP8124220.1 putative toxin-antitoxin system toxin component, PIN family [Caldilineaceae bacterium]MBP9073238.1 putative toxin-antitoxin system toxin component, PIN family [Caldilineaceae bacterium]
MRAVLDTNVFVSGLLRPQGVPGQILRLWRTGRLHLLYSPALLDELVNVLARPRLRKYGLQSDDVRAVIDFLHEYGQLVIPTEPLAVCRDPKDNHILEIALTSRADAIVSGDADLLVLHPFQGTPILSPADFMASGAFLAPPPTTG